MRSKFRLVGLKILKRRRKYDPEIIERTICLVLDPSTALCIALWIASRWGTEWRDLSKHPQRRQGIDPRLLWLLVRTPSVIWTELASRRAVHNILWRIPVYIFDILFLSPYMFVSALIGWLSSVFIRRIIYKCLNVCPFDYTVFEIVGRLGFRKPV